MCQKKGHFGSNFGNFGEFDDFLTHPKKRTSCTFGHFAKITEKPIFCQLTI